jgi:hypothetical protein
MQKQNRPYTPAEDNLVMNAINVDRMYYREVATAIDRSTSSVTNRVATLRKKGHNIIPVVRMPFGDERTPSMAPKVVLNASANTNHTFHIGRPTITSSDPVTEETTGDSLRIVNWILLGVLVCCVGLAVFVS